MEANSGNDNPALVFTDQEGERHVIPDAIVEQYRAEEDEKARAMKLHIEDCLGVFSPDELSVAEKLAAREIEDRHRQGALAPASGEVRE